MKLYIYKLDKIEYEGETESVTIPTVDGEITVLPHHIPLITRLKAGTVISRQSGATVREFPIAGGAGDISGERIILLAE